jgi:membrane peptidoglycan carboxypeptidase
MRVIPPQLRKARFAGAFEHEVVGADGHPRTLSIGPGTDRWTDLEDVSPFMAVAVQTTEDAGFYRHHGFNAGAIRASIIANLRAHRFVRGASTITMQLAKNLFLSREKTLSRKLEEVVLTDYLEGAFTKDEIMELYLNVVEFGPDIYGVGAAAEHYFGRSAAELSLGESLFLATLLPNPIGNHKRLYERREMPEYWTSNLVRLMGVAARAQRISPEEYAEGLKEHIQLFHVGDPAPQPREPARGGRPGIGNDDEVSDDPQ